ncbi:MAG: transposase [Phycisphaeraceae bacterium]|nr:transposase [Phycisphaeraceae bacterium]
MLPAWFQAFLMMLLEAWSARRDRQIQFLKLQIELLRQKTPGKRVILSPDDRRRLMRAGAAIGHEVDSLLDIVTVKTYRRWLREQADGQTPGRVRRPRAMTASLRELILRMARENVGWGVRRIVGELRKLALTPSRSSVRRVLVDDGVLPDPDRRAPKGVMTPWRIFVSAHMNCMVATDFFCKTVFRGCTPMGWKLAFALVFIHLGSRKAFVSPSTFHPTGGPGGWMQQHACNVSMWLEDEHLDLRFLIHDRDAKFTEAFDEHFRHLAAVSHNKTSGIVKTPYLAPIANCYAESWISGLKREVLNHLVCLSLRQLDHISASYMNYYNGFRPHQGLGNVPPAQHGLPPPYCPAEEPDAGRVECQHWLGGLLKHYHWKAA